MIFWSSCISGVSTQVGQIALTRMPYLPLSRAVTMGEKMTFKVSHMLVRVENHQFFSDSNQSGPGRQSHNLPADLVSPIIPCFAAVYAAVLGMAI